MNKENTQKFKKPKVIAVANQKRIVEKKNVTKQENISPSA